MNWHGYIVIERNTIGVNNWDDLLTLFDAMGTHDSPFPMYNTHSRVRLDGNAKIYESSFNPGEVSVDEFKQLLANMFGVPVEDIHHATSAADYAGWGTTVWTFSYNAIERFTVRRFGNGLGWSKSGDECREYLKLYKAEWELEGE